MTKCFGLDDQHYSAHLEGQRWCHEVHKLSADLEKAFNWILKELIFALQTLNVPEDLVQSNCFTSPSVQYPGETSLPFIISVWVHQGSSLLPLFFILCMDKSMVNLLLWIVDYRETKPKDSDIITTDCNTLLDTQAWVISSLGPPVPGRCLFA